MEGEEIKSVTEEKRGDQGGCNEVWSKVLSVKDLLWLKKVAL